MPPDAAATLIGNVANKIDAHRQYKRECGRSYASLFNLPISIVRGTIFTIFPMNASGLKGRRSFFHSGNIDARRRSYRQHRGAPAERSHLRT